jgi:hypothetical protein
VWPTSLKATLTREWKHRGTPTMRGPPGYDNDNASTTLAWPIGCRYRFALEGSADALPQGASQV